MMTRICFLFAFLLVITSCNKKSDTSAQSNKIAAASIQQLTKADFLTKISHYETRPFREWKYLGDKPAIVIFFQAEAAPYQTLAPILEELAAKYAGRIYVYKVDVETETDLVEDFRIKNIPSLLFAPTNEQPQMFTGAHPKEQLKTVIKTFLLKK